MTSPSIFQKLRPHLIAVFTFLAVSSIYFLPQFQGKVIQSGDTVSFLGMSKEVRDFNEKDSKGTLWTNAMFGGMPSYQIATPGIGNLIKYIEQLFRLFIDRPIGSFFTGMVLFYIFLMLLGVNHWMSIIGAICFSLNTNNLILYEAGHITKVSAIMYFGIITAGFLLVFKEKYILGGILFSVGVALDIYANHIQMTYYFFMVLGIYAFIEGFILIRKKNFSPLGKIVGVLGLGILLALGASTSKLWTTYEYSKDTMRGDPIIVKEASEATSSSNTSGLEWNYAMNWSNGFLDLFASFIPAVVGGSSGEHLGPDSAYAKAMKKRGARIGKGLNLPTYWGSLPGTSGPAYFGAAMVFLFLMGLVLVKGPIKWWLGLGVLLTMLLSMGKHFEFFNRLFFDYFPLFNKFRTPNSVLSVTAFLIPILGAMALSDIVKEKLSKEKVIKALKISLGISGGIALFFALFGPSFFDFTYNVDPTHSDAFYNQNYNIEIDLLKEDRRSLMRNDSIRSLVIVLLVGGLIWAFIQTKIKQTFLLIGIALIAVIDIWMVGKRYLNDENFVTKRDYENIYKPRDVDKEILKDSDPNYRVFDMSISTFNSSQSSYFHKTIGGYHAAKLQRYQDMIDYHISKGNPDVLNMLNTKYVITQDQKAQRIPNALGNAWFVNNIRSVNSPNEEISALSSFNPEEEAIVHNEFSNYVNGLDLQKNGNIQLTDYKPNHLSYASNSSSEQLAVFSEIWYGPNKGWQAYIDGEPVDHIRVNYCLRALKIPSGQHTIEFDFFPRKFYLGKKISIACSLLLLIAFFGLIGFGIKNQLSDKGAEQKVVSKEESSPKRNNNKSKKKKR